MEKNFMKTIIATLAGMFAMAGIILVFGLFRDLNFLVGICSFILGILFFQKAVSIK